MGAEERLGGGVGRESVPGDGPERPEAREPYEECDDDDLFAVAGRAYAYDGARESVVAHCRDAARGQGWRQRAVDCFSERIDGTTAHLGVEGPAGGSCQVELIADREEYGEGC